MAAFTINTYDATTPEGQARHAAANNRYAQHLARVEANRRSFGRKLNLFRAIGIGVPLAAAAAPLASIVGGGGGSTAAASSAGWSMPGVTAPTFAAPSIAAPAAATVARATPSALARLGSIFNSGGMELGVNAGLSLFGLRSQNKANNQARADAIRTQQQQIDLQLREIAERQRNADLDRDEAKRLNDQAHALQVRQLALSEGEAAERRSREARDDERLAPYRRISESAARQLASIWGVG